MKEHMSEEERVRMAANLKSGLPWQKFDLETKIKIILTQYEENYND